jgi:hypothetical protein
MIGNPTFLLDQMGDTLGSPQAGLVTQSLWTAFESPLEFAQVLRTQARLATGTTRFLQPGAPVLA